MLAVLDPGLFQTELSVAELQKLVMVLRPQTGIRLAAAKPYWSKFVQQIIRPISIAKEGDRSYRALLDQLLDAARAARDLQLLAPPPSVAVWGFRRLFDCCGSKWTYDMAEWLARCVVSGEPTILLTRLQLGRNAQRHGSGRLQLIEKTIWDLRLKPAGSPVVRVWCVREPRNVSVQITCRFDEALPFPEDPGSFELRFLPPTDWHKNSCPSPIRTKESRPAWIDEVGNAWATPNTPGNPYHWDVYLIPEHAVSHGLNQINVPRFGIPAREQSSGSLHHIPKKKRGRAKK